MKGKRTQEIRTMFNIECDLSEDKLKNMKNIKFNKIYY